MSRLLVVLFFGKSLLIRAKSSLPKKIWRDSYRAHPNNIPHDYKLFHQGFDNIRRKHEHILDHDEYWHRTMSGLIDLYAVQESSRMSLQRRLVGLVAERPSYEPQDGLSHFLGYMRAIKRHELSSSLKAPCNAAITGWLVEYVNPQHIKDMQSAGVSIADPSAHRDANITHDIDFVRSLGFDSATKKTQQPAVLKPRIFRVLSKNLSEMRANLTSRSSSALQKVDFLFISQDPRYTYLARKAGWQSLFIPRLSSLNTEDHTEYKGSINSVVASDLYGGLINANHCDTGAEDLIHDLGDAHLWRPPDLR